MKKSIGILLLVIGIGLGIYGFVSLDEDKSIIEIGELEVQSQSRDASSKTVWIFAAAGLALAGGLFLARQRKA